MCGRYSLFAPPGDIEERFDATFVEPFQPRYNAAPSQSLPVVADERADDIVGMEWGLVPPWADDRSDGGYINARSETLSETASFRDPFRQAGEVRCGRCLVLADGFYEWADTPSGTRPYRVTRADEEPFAMAGLWTEWQPPTEQTGLDAFAGGNPGDAGGPDPVETFTIVTTEPAGVVADLHHRMAVILPEGREREWLTAPPDAATDLLAPFEGDLDAYRVSEAVNDPSNDTPAVAEPIY